MVSVIRAVRRHKTAKAIRNAGKHGLLARSVLMTLRYRIAGISVEGLQFFVVAMHLKVESAPVKN